MSKERTYLRFPLRLGFILLVLVVAWLAAGCSRQYTSATSSPPAPSPSPAKTRTSGLVQSNSAGAVTIEVKWLAEKTDSLVFEVSMNTHSVDLDSYDLKKLAVLGDDQGKEYRPVSWNSAAGGHHREGRLAFSLPDSLKEGRAKFIELRIRDIAGVKERTFRWTV